MPKLEPIIISQKLVLGQILPEQALDFFYKWTTKSAKNNDVDDDVDDGGG